MTNVSPSLRIYQWPLKNDKQFHCVSVIVLLYCQKYLYLNMKKMPFPEVGHTRTKIVDTRRKNVEDSEGKYIYNGVKRSRKLLIISLFFSLQKDKEKKRNYSKYDREIGKFWSKPFLVPKSKIIIVPSNRGNFHEYNDLEDFQPNISLHSRRTLL